MRCQEKRRLSTPCQQPLRSVRAGQCAEGSRLVRLLRCHSSTVHPHCAGELVEQSAHTTAAVGLVFVWSF